MFSCSGDMQVSPKIPVFTDFSVQVRLNHIAFSHVVITWTPHSIFRHDVKIKNLRENDLPFLDGVPQNTFLLAGTCTGRMKCTPLNMITKVRNRLILLYISGSQTTHKLLTETSTARVTIIWIKTLTRPVLQASLIKQNATHLWGQ